MPYGWDLTHNFPQRLQLLTYRPKLPAACVCNVDARLSSDSDRVSDTATAPTVADSVSMASADSRLQVPYRMLTDDNTSVDHSDTEGLLFGGDNHIFTAEAAAADDDGNDRLEHDDLMHCCSMHMLAGKKIHIYTRCWQIQKTSRI